MHIPNYKCHCRWQLPQLLGTHSMKFLTCWFLKHLLGASDTQELEVFILSSDYFYLVKKDSETLSGVCSTGSLQPQFLNSEWQHLSTPAGCPRAAFHFIPRASRSCSRHCSNGTISHTSASAHALRVCTDTPALWEQRESYSRDDSVPPDDSLGSENKTGIFLDTNVRSITYYFEGHLQSRDGIMKLSLVSSGICVSYLK